MENLTTILLVVAGGLILLDLFVPSGGLLSGTGIALLIERALAAAGVATEVRLPLAAVGMALTVGLAIRFGERVSEALFPARTKTNVDRLVGLTAKVYRVDANTLVITLEGDLWTARAAAGTRPLIEGEQVLVEALIDQVPVVRPTDEEG